MTNDHADDGEDASDGAGGLGRPGGGPRRVVSERSVDDILESVNGDGADDDVGGTLETRVESEPVGASDDAATGETEARDGATSEDEANADDGETGDGETIDGETVDRGTKSDNDEVRDGSKADDGKSAVESDGRETAGDGDADDGREGNEESEPDADALAARVEAGDVTGADVRAAEAGEGRDPTPDVDEIDLSLDDLETGGSSPDEASTTAATSDAGPLAGSIDEGTTPGGSSESAADGSGDGDDESTGLIGRLRGLFSRSS